MAENFRKYSKIISIIFLSYKFCYHNNYSQEEEKVKGMLGHRDRLIEACFSRSRYLG